MKSKQDLELFCKEWLKAWTGNQPDYLRSFYTKDAVYSDPARPHGISGESILPYFQKLLAKNPHWQWTLVELFPSEKGFTFKWMAEIPTPNGLIKECGMDIVEIENGKISRNEVYFDRSAWLSSSK